MAFYYGSLCTEFYDLTKPWALEDELTFYQTLLGNLQSPILEAMCGTGRLLIPLIEKGYLIEGVDNSADMLAKCRDKAKIKNLSPILYEANISNMKLNKKYENILIAVGSFQLLHSREVAKQTLVTLKEHLIPGGRLLLETFIPWDALCAEKNRTTQEVSSLDNSIIKLSISDELNKLEQYYDSTLLYEKIREGKVIKTETEFMRISWYYKYEMKLLLENIGFHSIILHDVDYSINPNGIVYEAVA